MLVLRVPFSIYVYSEEREEFKNINPFATVDTLLCDELLEHAKHIAIHVVLRKNYEIMPLIFPQL